MSGPISFGVVKTLPGAWPSKLDGQRHPMNHGRIWTKESRWTNLPVDWTDGTKYNWTLIRGLNLTETKTVSTDLMFTSFAGFNRWKMIASYKPFVKTYPT